MLLVPLVMGGIALAAAFGLISCANATNDLKDGTAPDGPDGGAGDAAAQDAGADGVLPSDQGDAPDGGGDPHARKGAWPYFQPGRSGTTCSFFDLDVAEMKFKSVCAVSRHEYQTVAGPIDAAQPMAPKGAFQIKQGINRLMFYFVNGVRKEASYTIPQIFPSRSGMILPASGDDPFQNPQPTPSEKSLLQLQRKMEFLADGGVFQKGVLYNGTVQGPYLIFSGETFLNAKGEESLVVAASDAASKDRSGLVMTYKLDPNGGFKATDPGTSVRIAAKSPSGIALFDDNRKAAVLNQDPNRPSVDLVDLERQGALIKSISIPLASRPLQFPAVVPEVAVNAERTVIAFLAEQVNPPQPPVQAELVVVDLMGMTASSVALSDIPRNVRDVAICRDKAYVSFPNQIVAVDISDPKAPFIEGAAIGQIYDAGALAVYCPPGAVPFGHYPNPILFVAAGGLWWHQGPDPLLCPRNNTEPFCRKYIAAIDPKRVEPWIAPAAGDGGTGRDSASLIDGGGD